MVIIDDLSNVERTPVELSDLSQVKKEDIVVDGLINIPLVKGDKGDKGEKGEQGQPNQLTIGTVESGEEAVATIEGEAPNQVLNLVLPKGEKGEMGPPGTDGESYNDTELRQSVNNKVDKVEGKELSSNDFTDELKQKLDDIGEGSFLPTRRNNRTSTSKSK